MVLPEPAAHDESGQAVGWLDEIALTLRLSAGAALVLVDKADPARLGDLVRTLRHDFPKIDVLPDVSKLADVEPGSTIVLTPQPEDAEWLNLRRGQFAERKLKVVLFCSEETTLALKFRAPDFYDWIGRQKDCPPGPVPFAVRGIRAAFEAEWPVAWTGSPERSRVEEAVRAAFPGEEVVWLSAESPFEEVVKGMGATAIVLVEANTERRLRRARWARAAAQRQSRVVLMAGAQEAPGFWPVHDRQMRLIDAQKKLGKVGIVGPGGVAAMLDLEPEAMELLTQAVKQRRADTTKQLTEALDHMDSGAALDRLIEPSKWLDALDWELPPLIEQICPLRMRAHFNRPAARAQWARYLRLDGALKTNREAWLRGWGEPHDWLNHVGVVAPHIQDRAQGLELAEDALRLSPPVPVWIELVLRFQPEDRFDLLLIAAARLAQMGEGDVIAWTLRSVRDSYVASVLAPVLPQLAGETDEDVLLETLHGAIARMRRSWKAEVVWTAVAHAETSRLLSWVLAFGSALACALSLGLRHDIAFKVSSAAFVVAFIVLLWVEIAARRSTPGLRVRNLTTRLADIEKKLVPTRAMRVSQIQSTLQRIHEDIGAERGGESEAAARQAVQDVSVDLKSTPLHAEAVFLLASILRGDGRQKEAEEIIAPLFAASGVPLSKGLLTLAARLLAETGRAAAAVQGLLHLTELDLPSALNLRPSPAPAGAGDPLVTRMLLEPPGVLAGEPEAHLTLVDALLKQGRYPEALLVAREATARFTDRDEKAVAELKARCLDLERRTGAARAG